MFRHRQREWIENVQRKRNTRPRSRISTLTPTSRRIGVESLEDRRMLAAVTVDNDLDLVNGDTSSIANLIANDGGDGIALREALEAANNTVGSDSVNFHASLNGGTINLSDALGELLISDAIIVDGPGADLLSIDAGDGTDNMFGTDDGFRVVRVDDGDNGNIIDVEIRSLTLTGGDVDGNGGAIFTYENLTVTDSVITGNSARFGGGGVYNITTTVTIEDSTISGNSADRGGGMYNFLGTVDMTESTISGNASAVDGGGLYNFFGTMNITDSTISNNLAGDDGGGVFTEGSELTITRSTISANTAVDGGGGILSKSKFLGTRITTITNSTISGNSAATGGGLKTNEGRMVIEYSTITLNSATGDGAGVRSFAGPATVTEVRSSIIAGNVGDDDVSQGLTDILLSLGYNVIGGGDGVGAFVETGDQTGVFDPLLGPLQDNGGPTQTHALLPSSPAFDAGDPSFVGPPDFDQRGTDYERVYASAIDIGAYELLLADGNLDGQVDGLDYLLWASHFGDDPASDPPGSPQNGDYNGDGKVDGLDYLVWAGQFGEGTAVVAIAPDSEMASAEDIAAIDAAIEDDYDTGATVADDPTARQWHLSRAFDSVLKIRHDKRNDHT